MLKPNMSENYVNPWPVLINIPNLLGWFRLILLFVSLRYFGKRNYTLFIVYHTLSGLLDSFDGDIARAFNQTSHVGQYLDSILDQYAHILIYAAIGYLYSSYIVFFFLEIALDLWISSFSSYLHWQPNLEKAWPQEPTFIAEICSSSLWDHPNMRLFRWYGSDIFHALLVVRYILIHENDQKYVLRLKRYISIPRLQYYLRIVLIVTGISSVLRLVFYSCSMLDKFYRMAMIK